MENKKLEEFTEDEDILMSILDGEETEITLKSINPLEKMDIYQMQYIEDKHWYFRYKNKVLKGLLEKYIVGENLDILDIGVGTGTISKELDKLGKTIHIDNSDSVISFNKKVNPELEIIKAEVPWNTSVLEDKKFDYIVMFNLLEYVDNGRWIVDVLKSHLKPEGKILISTMSGSSVLGINDKAYGIIHKYSLEELKEMFSLELLKVEEYTFFENPSIYKKISEGTDKVLKEDDLYWNYISKDNNITYDYYESKEYKQVIKNGIKQGNQLFVLCSRMTTEDKEKIKKEQEAKKERNIIDKLIDIAVNAREKKEREKEKEED